MENLLNFKETGDRRRKKGDGRRKKGDGRKEIIFEKFSAYNLAAISNNF